MEKDFKIKKAKRFNKVKAERDFQISIENIENNISLYKQGKQSSYTVVATELRKLLYDCGTPLIWKIIPEIKLHPLCNYVCERDDIDLNKIQGINNGLVLDIPGFIGFTNGKIEIESLFNEQENPIELEKWLLQKLYNKNITILELIRSVGDKEATHSDPDYNETLQYTNLIKLGPQEIHIHTIIAIGNIY